MKYIVYLTTNLVNKKIYIGVHGTENPDKFDGYLGNGVKINDRSTYRYSKTPFEAAVNKYGPDKFIRKTLKVFDNLEDALDLERWLVCPEFIARKDTYNIALGGGIPPAKVKTIYQYTLEGAFIKEWPSITEASLEYKCSSSCIGKAIFDRTPSLGYLWTDYKYESINPKEFKIDENKTKCYLYDINGIYLQEFNSITECAKFIGIKMETLSTSIKGKYLCNNSYYVSIIKYSEYPVINVENHRNCPVYQYDLEGNFIKEFMNVMEAKKEIGDGLNIYKSIRLGTSSKGFQWSWKKLPKMKKLITKTQARKVGKYTKDGKLLQVFNTVREAKKDTCGAPNVLSGKRKTAGGYVWKYIE